MEVSLPSDLMCSSVPIEDITGAIEARRLVTLLAEALQFSEADVGRACLVVTEAATNIARHAGHGEMLFRRCAMNAGAAIEIVALDSGPGMANVAQCMKDGFSTGGSRGVGLGAIERLSTKFDIISIPGKGTALLSRIVVRPKRSLDTTQGAQFMWGVVGAPLRGQEVSGDAWAVQEAPLRTRVLVVDGLGHGLHAFDAAQEALRSFHSISADGPEATLRTLDKDLRGTRGAAALMVDIHWARRELQYAGVGNIGGMLLPSVGKGTGLVSHPGALGQATRRFQQFTHRWPEKGLLVLHSDGLSSRWDLRSYPGLSQRDPSLVASVLYRDFRTRNDDVVIFVGRESDSVSMEPP